MNEKALVAQIALHAHGRVPRELRRKQVLAEAHDLFVERGYQAASMDELARRVGVSKPVIYDLAGSKEQLFRDVLASVEAELAAQIASAAAEPADLAGKLHAGILAFLRFAHSRRVGWAALRSVESGATSEIAAMRRIQAELVAALIVDGARRDGRHLDHRTAEVLARAINGAVEFVALWWLARPERTAEALAELLTDLLSPGLRSLTGRPGPKPSRARAGQKRASGGTR